MRSASHSSFLLLSIAALVLLLSTAAPWAHGQSGEGLTRGPGLEVDGSRYNRNAIYRPSDADFRLWQDGRFNLIYQDGAQTTARYMKGALQSSWPKVDSRVGF